ncbi:MAG: TOBE domain-containing protein [Phycisphaerales bacterium]
MGGIPGSRWQAAESGARDRVSCRPESLRSAQSGSFSSSIVSKTYLGEVAHHRARHESGGELAISEFAPGPRSAFQGRVSLTVSPDDAVILVD